MTLRACAARARTRLAAERGFGVTEVLVSALIVVLISLSTLTAIDAAGRTQDTNKSRSVASSLAQDDIERLRAMKITQLADLGADTDPRTVLVDGEKYFVKSKGEYLAGQAGSDNCASDDEAPKYLKLTSTVTWPTMRAAKPVEANSLRATPSGTIGDFGSLAVDINGRAGAGQEGIVVKIVPDAEAAANGGVTTEATTNAKGCVLFGYIATGRYTISFAKPGWVLAPYPNDPTEEDTAVVAADSIASKAYQYDQGAAATVNYIRNASWLSTTWGGTGNTTTGTGFTIQNASLGSPDFKTFANDPATPTATSTSGLVNFPYTGGWEAWAGVCMGNKPPTAGDRGAVTLTPGSTVSTNVREFRLRVQVQRRTTNTASATNNYGTTPNDGRTIVKFSPTTPGCTDTVNATWVSPNTGSTGTATGNYSTWEAIVPWGSYTVCAQYVHPTTTVNRAKATVNNVATTTSAGTLWTNGSTKITIPYTQTGSYTC
ncbi:MAG TPA: hypothetical protein VEX39_11725 [Thermoleophilaceae bacterium]|nr:hypothetical protein [Thermoleophilaceae bacterium]